MPREFTRSDRVSDAIQRLLAQVIPAEIRDPRIGMVNINEVTVTRDMAFAKVYVTFVGVDDEKQSLEAAAILNLSSMTVDTHRANIMQKLKLKNAVEIALYAVRRKIVC